MNPLIPNKASFKLFLICWFLSISIFKVSSATTMKVHPLSKKRPHCNSTPESSQTLMMMPHHHQKKLRRLPHVFSRVLELPIKSDADVSIKESSDCFQFTVAVTENLRGGHIRVRTIEIHPGVVKIVVNKSGRSDVELLKLDELELDKWRYRLPESTRPEQATAVCDGGELIVTVPKVGGGEREIWGGIGRIVLVQ